MEIEKMTVEEIEQRITEIDTELTTAAPEDLDVEALNKELDALEARRAEIVTAAAEKRSLLDKVAGMKKAPLEAVTEERKEDNKMNLTEARNSKQYIDAYAEYVKERIDADECRAVLTELAGENLPEGTAGVPVPTFVSDLIETAWENDVIMGLVRKSNFKGIFAQGFELSASPAEIHAEGGDEVDEEELKHGIVSMSPQSIKKWVSVSKATLATRNGEEFLRYIYDELTYQIVKYAASLLLGIISSASTTSSTTAVGLPEVEISALGLGDIFTGIGSLTGRAADLTAVMNRKTWAAYKALQLGANYPVDLFENVRVAFDDSLPAFADANVDDIYMIIGDFDLGARANFPNGDEVEIIIDPYSAKKKNLVEVLGEQYVGLGVVVPNSFVRFKKVAGE